MLVPLILALCSSKARAAEVPDPLVSAWAGTPVSASWIFVLETSGAYLPIAEAARDDIARLVEALPVGDRVEVIALHTRASPILPFRTVAEDTRTALAAEVRALKLPSAKSTDLGAGLASIATALDAPGGGGARFVVVMGSFCHSPSVASEYADGGYGCRAIRGLDSLDAAFDDGADRATIAATLFPVATPAQPVHAPGLAVVHDYFAPAAAVETATEPLKTWVTTRIASLAASRVRPLARAEAATLALHAVVVDEPAPGNPNATIRLSAGLEHLALDATAITVTGARAGRTSLRLGPDAILPLTVDVPAPPFSFVPVHDVVDIPVSVRLDGTLSPADSLRDAGIDPAHPALSAAVTIHAARTYGLSAGRGLAMLVSALLLGAAGTLSLRRSLSPLRLGGAFTYRHAGGPRQPLPIQGLAEAAVVVRPDGSLGVGRPDDAVFVLRVERPLWNAHVIAEIRASNVEINTRRVPPGRHVVVPGATSFQFKDYRLSWE
jgi:hypothetical protein